MLVACISVMRKMHGDKYNVICVMRGTNIARLGIPVCWKIDPATQGVREREFQVKNS